MHKTVFINKNMTKIKQRFELFSNLCFKPILAKC